MKLLRTLSFVFLAAAATAADRPYNEAADAKREIQQALTQAAAAKVPVIVVFGANWCGDCIMLDTAMKKGASAPLLSRDFKMVKVNVGRFDKNLEIAKSYAVPLEKGIPAVVIVSTNNAVLYATRAGELANARKMGDQGIYEFFKRVASTTAPKTSDPDRSDRTTNDPVLISLRWLLDGQIEVRGRDNSGIRYTEYWLLRLRDRLKKTYPRTLPVVLGYPGSKQQWFTFLRDESRLVSQPTGTNTVSSPAVQIFAGQKDHGAHVVHLRYSMTVVDLEVVMTEGKAPAVTVTNFALLD